MSTTGTSIYTRWWALFTCLNVMPLIFQNDRSKQFSEFGKVSYDETNQRVRIIEQVIEGTEKEYFDTLYLHNIVSLS